MSDPILPWPARRPALLDSTSAPLDLPIPDPVQNNRGVKEHTPRALPRAELPTQQPDPPAPARPATTVQLITPSAALHGLLARYQQAFDLAVTEIYDPDPALLDHTTPDTLSESQVWDRQEIDDIQADLDAIQRTLTDDPRIATNRTVRQAIRQIDRIKARLLALHS